MSHPTNNTSTTGLVDSVKNAASYVSESAQETAAQASKEANIATAKNSNATIADRASAALNAVSDKIQESAHGAKADAHREMAEGQAKK